MIILDTNILARLILGDDPVQQRRAQALLNGPLGPLLVPDVVFAETLWVLVSVGKLSRQEQIKAGQQLLIDPRLVCENTARLSQALDLCNDHNVDFTEAYASATAMELDADGVASFDKDLKNLPVKWVKP